VEERNTEEKKAMRRLEFCRLVQVVANSSADECGNDTAKSNPFPSPEATSSQQLTGACAPSSSSKADKAVEDTDCRCWTGAKAAAPVRREAKQRAVFIIMVAGMIRL